MTEALGRSFASLRIPNFRRYFAGQLVSLSGNWMQMIAEMWLVLSLTGSGLAVGVTTALQFLPMLIFGAWGGLIADRVPKRRLLLLTQGLHMIAPLTMLALAAGAPSCHGWSSAWSSCAAASTPSTTRPGRPS